MVSATCTHEYDAQQQDYSDEPNELIVLIYLFYYLSSQARTNHYLIMWREWKLDFFELL